MDANLYHIVVYTPLSHANLMREALADAGAGQIGNYDSCSFSSRGIGRFRPLKGSDPSIGGIDKLEEVEEERIEVVVTEEHLEAVLKAAKKAHLYEEPAIHVMPMMDYKKILENRE